MTPGDTRKQSQWNHFWHPTHCTISLPVYGSLNFNHFFLQDFKLLAAMLSEGKGTVASVSALKTGKIPAYNELAHCILQWQSQ